MYVCMYVCMYICMYICMYVYMYVYTMYMYACMYVRTYACLRLSIYLHHINSTYHINSTFNIIINIPKSYFNKDQTYFGLFVWIVTFTDTFRLERFPFDRQLIKVGLFCTNAELVEYEIAHGKVYVA